MCQASSFACSTNTATRLEEPVGPDDASRILPLFITCLDHRIIVIIMVVIIIMDLFRLPEARVQELAADLVAALHYLHSNRILHRWALLHKVVCDRSIRS